jgi:ubiquinone biosynthesis UbiH/UbiF/VisC/COQ6 family hydroxylase
MENHSRNAAETLDVVIVGAGPAGLALACALSDLGLGVRLLEQHSLTALEAPEDDGREIAITHRSRQLMERLRLWDAIPVDVVAPLREARVLDGDGDGEQALRFATPPRESDPLGWLIPNHHIRAAALAAARRRPGVALRCDARVVAIDLGDDRASVTLADGQRHDAALVVAADSRFSQVRRMAGIGASMRDFGRSVVVACMAHEKDHGGIAWECFRYGNTLALLPMNDRRSSVVVTVPSHAVDAWLAMPAPEFAARVEMQAGARLGAMRQVGERHHYPLVGVYAQRFCARRFAVVGDAAVGMHPVTAHGWNLALRGVETLANELHAALRSGAGIGDRQALEAFDRAHRQATWPLYVGTNALVSLFTDERPPAKLVRRVVLDAAARMPVVSDLVKAIVTRQLTSGAMTGQSRSKFPRRPGLFARLP